MSELRELYQTVILDHSKKPRNFGICDPATHQADGFNPLCGDKIKLSMQVHSNVAEEVRFEGEGCAISTAAASMMTELVRGKSTEEINELFTRFHELVTGDPLQEVSIDEKLGKLSVFSGVREFPMRVKCATLCWHTLRSALSRSEEAVSTE